MVAAWAFACGAVSAQDYPARPVTVVVPFSAGSASDVMARIVLDRMVASFGQRFVGTTGLPPAATSAPLRSSRRRPMAIRFW